MAKKKTEAAPDKLEKEISEVEQAEQSESEKTGAESGHYRKQQERRESPAESQE